MKSNINKQKDTQTGGDIKPELDTTQKGYINIKQT
jgi:hypothetical protein